MSCAKQRSKALASPQAVPVCPLLLETCRPQGRGAGGAQSHHGPVLPPGLDPHLGQDWKKWNGPCLAAGASRDIQLGHTQQSLQEEERGAEICPASSRGGKSFSGFPPSSKVRCRQDIEVVITAVTWWPPVPPAPGQLLASLSPVHTAGCKVGSMIPTLQRRKQRLRDVKQPVQGHTACREIELTSGGG